MVKKKSTQKSKPLYVAIFENDDKYYVRSNQNGSIIASKTLEEGLAPFVEAYRGKMSSYEGAMSMAIFDVQVQPKICKTTEKAIISSIKLPTKMVGFGSLNGLPCNCSTLYKSKNCVSVSKKALF